ncbi:hemerythrin [Paenibacillus sp. LMG 31456]|uniref:Hemerythrin n=2 Tax=Paenibacillus foliorum TaxID=2654974 RepID=A0A972GJ61_9BACL|nr:hemerythrin [Paenibacillus foliorum]
MESGTAHSTELSAALDRLTQEHGELMQVLLDMESQARQLEQETDMSKALPSLLHLRLWVKAFMQELERHSEWEKKELFPFLNNYFHQELSPSMIPSFWALEKDHELAEEYIQYFLRAVHEVKQESELGQLHQALAYLIHACRILKEHLAKEEQLVFPMTEQVLTDLDYLFS